LLAERHLGFKPMKTIGISGESHGLADFAHNVSTEPVVVADQGAPLAYVVPLEPDDEETISLSKNPKFNEIIQQSLDSYATEGGIPSAEVRRLLGID
jgi:antitoxin (DNA-binding transcriptional repressor) of toxin-antitoxin stability system